MVLRRSFYARRAHQGDRQERVEKTLQKLVKEDLKSAGIVLYTGAEALRICAVLLSPIMPQRIKTLLSVLNTDSVDRNWGGLKSGTKLGEHKPLFPRINSDIF